MERHAADRVDHDALRHRSVPEDPELFVRTAPIPVVGGLRGWDTQPLPVPEVEQATVVVSAAGVGRGRSRHRPGRRPAPERGPARRGPKVVVGVLAALAAGLVTEAAVTSGPVDVARPASTASTASTGATASTAATERPPVPPAPVAPTARPPVPAATPAAAVTPRPVLRKPGPTRRNPAGGRHRPAPWPTAAPTSGPGSGGHALDLSDVLDAARRFGGW